MKLSALMRIVLVCLLLSAVFVFYAAASDGSNESDMSNERAKRDAVDEPSKYNESDMANERAKRDAADEPSEYNDYYYESRRLQREAELIFWTIVLCCCCVFVMMAVFVFMEMLESRPQTTYVRV